MPDNSAQIAGTILKDEQNKYLLVQETRSDIYGKWGLPAGHVDEGETLQQAAIRETHEETGYETRIIEDSPFFESVTTNNHRYSVFKAKIVGGKLKIDQTEQLDVKWFNADEIDMLNSQGKLRDPLIIKVIYKAEKNENSGD